MNELSRPSEVSPFLQLPEAAFGKPVCRLGLATRGNSALAVEDVLEAIAQGIDFLNWPGVDDCLARVIAKLGSMRDRVVVCAQFEARAAAEAKRELRSMLSTLGTDYIDVLTFYYVEAVSEWEQIIGPGGALEYCQAAQRDGTIRRIGLTTHQRHLAALAAQSGKLDALMIRYNAAHRGAEREVFPVTDALSMPVITYTALRWGALLRPTPDDPPGSRVPSAPAWYRFALQSRSVSVVVAAPHNRAQLDEDLEVLHAPGPLDPAEFEQLAAHGARVRSHAGSFP